MRSGFRASMAEMIADLFHRQTFGQQMGGAGMTKRVRPKMSDRKAQGA
jgi:hypothetical protein